MILHYTTSNLSALKMYHILKEMGIKNCGFFLALYDEDLLNVNPLDEESLTDELKAKILREVVRNHWYYIRECVRIPSAGLERFEFHRGNIALIWAMQMCLNSVVILPRQFGKTYGAVSEISHEFYYGANNSEFLFFGNNNSIVSQNLGRLKSIRDNLPQYLQVQNPKTDKDNEFSLTYTALENGIRTKCGQKSPDMARQAGRGFSTNCQWSDETFFTSNVDIIMGTSMPSFKRIAENAKKNNLPYWRLWTSTPGILDTKEGKWGFDFIQKCATFHEGLYDIPRDELEDYIRRESKPRFIKIEFMYYDLGRDYDYVEGFLGELTPEEIDSSVLNKWLSVAAEHPLGRELVSKLQNNIMQPICISMIDKIYMLRFYQKPELLDPKIPYVLGLDTSSNVGRDYTALVVRHPYTLEVVAVMRTNMHSAHRFAHAIAGVMMKFFPNGVLVGERNHNGSTVLDTIRDVYPEVHVYDDPETEAPGVHNGKKVRDQLFNEILRLCVVDDAHRIHDSNIIREIAGLRMTRRGRIDHDPKLGHDDTLVAFLYTHWFLMYGVKRERYLPVHLIASQSGPRSDALQKQGKSNEGGATLEGIMDTVLTNRTYREATVSKTLNVDDIRKMRDDSMGKLQESSIMERFTTMMKNKHSDVEDVGIDMMDDDLIAEVVSDQTEHDENKKFDNRVYNMDPHEISRKFSSRVIKPVVQEESRPRVADRRITGLDKLIAALRR